MILIRIENYSKKVNFIQIAMFLIFLQCQASQVRKNSIRPASGRIQKPSCVTAPRLSLNLNLKKKEKIKIESRRTGSYKSVDARDDKPKLNPEAGRVIARAREREQPTSEDVL